MTRFQNKEKVQVEGPRAPPPPPCGNLFGFELSKVPFPVFLTDSRKTVETGMEPPLLVVSN